MTGAQQNEAINAVRRLANCGQSAWIDFIERKFLVDGSFARLIEEDGISGVTSNPSIFEKAMGHGTDYDEEFKLLAASGDHDAQSIYEHLAISDIRRAADLLLDTYRLTGARDGYVSLEVSPYLALRTDETVAEAHRLWRLVDRPNLMLKVPGTRQGVPAVRRLIADGINVNITLIFGRDAYRQIVDAWISGLEDRLHNGGDLRHVASVASCFVSRIDSVMDQRIDARVKAGDERSADLQALRGKIAIANAKVAYQQFREMTSEPRWRALAEHGAQPQKLLWASTGTKDRAYRDTLYVEELIGQETVDTMPPQTLDAFRDHGEVRDTLVEGVAEARRILDKAEHLALDLQGVTEELVDDGVEQFATAADKLLGAISAKRATLLGEALARLNIEIPHELRTAVDAGLEDWRVGGGIRRLWEHDASVWTGNNESHWLGWLHIVDNRLQNIENLEEFQAEVCRAGFKHVIVLGMGGSSLGPEVLAKSFGQLDGWPRLLVLDSTDPQQISAFEHSVDLGRTLFVVSSKSGSTLEPNILQAYLFERVKAVVGPARAPAHFMAITDPKSPLQTLAQSKGFRRVFFGDRTIGGRYSVLSNFGMVPAAAMGLNVREFLSDARLMVRSCSSSAPPEQNPGVGLGLALGVAVKSGLDKVTIVASPGIADFGAWLEQLLAESTGKHGTGIVPIDGEPLASPDRYGEDRVFAYVRLVDEPDAKQDERMAALIAAGRPVLRLDLAGRHQLGQAFFLWEMATAVAGAVMGLDPFDQPDVEASKQQTERLMKEYSVDGKLSSERPFAVDGVYRFYRSGDSDLADAGRGDALEAILRGHLAQVLPHDYVALLAYIERTPGNESILRTIRARLREAKGVATVAEFGPRFLHSTGQTYKGGPNSGVFLEITADDHGDLAVPGKPYSFGTVKSAQARGDFEVLSARGRRVLRVHITGDLEPALCRLADAIAAAA